MTLKRLRKMADRGNAAAQFELGLMYEIGDGVPKDARESFDWLHLAAEQGHPLAQTHIGIALINGQGTQKNAAEGIEWLFSAANYGCADGRFALANMYKHGHHGLPQDHVQALMWLELSVRTKPAYARYRDDIAHNMTPAQIEQAQKFAREWKPPDCWD